MAGKGDFGWKLLVGVATLGAGMVARTTLRQIWKASTGKEPPTNPEHPDITLGEALGWAVLSGAVVGVARMMASREAAKRWRKTTGALPPGLDDLA